MNDKKNLDVKIEQMRQVAKRIGPEQVLITEALIKRIQERLQKLKQQKSNENSNH